MVADDAFVRDLFAPGEERVSVKDAEFMIFPPRTMSALLSIKSRVWAGN